MHRVGWMLLGLATVLTLVGLFAVPETKGIGLVAYAVGAVLWGATRPRPSRLEGAPTT